MQSSCRSMQINQKSGDKKATKSKPVLNYSPKIINQVTLLNDLLQMKCRKTLNPFTSSLCIKYEGMFAVCQTFISVCNFTSAHSRMASDWPPRHNTGCWLANPPHAHVWTYLMWELELQCLPRLRPRTPGTRSGWGAGPVISSNYWTRALINNETSAKLLQNF